MKLKVNVTRDDIKRGVRENIHLCPIARALRRLGFSKISVDQNGIEIRNKVFDIPPKASRFINDFDFEELVKPFSFVMREY